MISRYLVIVLALGSAAYRLANGATVEGAGLLGLAVGLIFLKIGERRPVFRRAAFGAFAITGLAILLALWRIWQHGG